MSSILDIYLYGRFLRHFFYSISKSVFLVLYP